MKIGFFDTGLGGLTILRAVRKRMPGYDYLFFGDTVNVPYGGKSEAEVFELTKAGVIRLFKAGAAIVIVACNTASAESVRKLQDSILEGVFRDRKILGVIIPTIEELHAMGAEHALLIGTERTVKSEKYTRELLRIAPAVVLEARATPALVPLIESGEIDAAAHLVDDVLAHVKGRVDTLVLGCTHYTVLKERLKKTHPQLRIISQDDVIPAKLEAYLKRHGEIERKLSRRGTITITESGANLHVSDFKRKLLEELGE
ncbi:MAG TPA: glutamate racemase [Candidatus Paceibacterota bacterium]|nr:glutamate racemase [Candidatus Paceibacterota bacterium]